MRVVLRSVAPLSRRLVEEPCGHGLEMAAPGWPRQGPPGVEQPALEHEVSGTEVGDVDRRQGDSGAIEIVDDNIVPNGG